MAQRWVQFIYRNDSGQIPLRFFNVYVYSFFSITNFLHVFYQSRWLPVQIRRSNISMAQRWVQFIYRNYSGQIPLRFFHVYRFFLKRDGYQSKFVDQIFQWLASIHLQEEFWKNSTVIFNVSSLKLLNKHFNHFAVIFYSSIGTGRVNFHFLMSTAISRRTHLVSSAPRS